MALLLTLLAHNRVNTGWHTVLNMTTQTGQDRVLRESGRGKRLHTGLVTSLGAGVRTWPAGWLPHPPAAIFSLASATQLLDVIHPLLTTTGRLWSFSDQDTFLLLANQWQDIHLDANSGHLYHFCSSDNIANLWQRDNVTNAIFTLAAATTISWS